MPSPDNAMTLENIGFVYEQMSDLKKITVLLRKTAIIRGQALPPTHHDLVPVEQDIPNIFNLN